MFTVQAYLKFIRVLAGLAIFTTGLLESIYNPGMLDLFNGAAIGLVLYSLWRGYE